MFAAFAALVVLQSETPPPVRLLGAQQVRRELNLSYATSAKILTLLNRAGELERGGLMSLAESRRLDEERRRTPPEGIRLQTAKLLTPTQVERLRQIEWQRIQPWLLSDPFVVTRIGSSKEQFGQVLRLQSVAYKAYESTIQRSTQMISPSGSEAGKLVREASTTYRADCERALEQVLTHEQFQRLKRLLGKPFNTERLTYDTRSFPSD